ncbi:MAG: hypothetical protein ACNA70_05895, partial [Brevefilum sp.]
LCEAKDVGVMTIKAIAKGPWGDREPHFHTWYEPFDDQETIQKMVNFSLSQKLAHICTVGDYRIMGKVLTACENFTPLNHDAQEALITEHADLEIFFLRH